MKLTEVVVPTAHYVRPPIITKKKKKTVCFRFHLLASVFDGDGSSGSRFGFPWIKFDGEFECDFGSVGLGVVRYEILSMI